MLLEHRIVFVVINFERGGRSVLISRQWGIIYEFALYFVVVLRHLCCERLHWGVFVRKNDLVLIFKRTHPNFRIICDLSEFG